MSTPDKRPDVEGIAARAKSEWADRRDRLVSKDIPALIAYIKALEAVVLGARLVAEGTAIEVGTTLVRMQVLRKALAALDGGGDG